MHIVQLQNGDVKFHNLTFSVFSLELKIRYENKNNYRLSCYYKKDNSHIWNNIYINFITSEVLDTVKLNKVWLIETYVINFLKENKLLED